jgi:hypothetical protein
MFDWMLPEKHAVAILKSDHHTVKGLFDDFDKAEKTSAKEKIIDQAVTAAMVVRANGRGDSPAKAAADHKPSRAMKAPEKLSASRERKTSSHVGN